MEANYTYLKNNAFGGFVIDKIYQTTTEMTGEEPIGRYVLVIGTGNENAVYQRVWRSDDIKYEFITSLNPFSREEEEAIKAQFDKAIAEFDIESKKMIESAQQQVEAAVAAASLKWQTH